MEWKELDKILENHKHWMFHDCNDWESMKADLRGANLRRAYVRRADLSYTNLYGADLRGADLSEANLIGAVLSEANLRYTDLYGATNIPFVPMACPEEGSFIGYKKARDLIIKLEICEDARRSSATGRKCRCDKAKVISITNEDGTDSGVIAVASNYDEKFIYQIGEIVEEPDFCEDRFNECSKGIHFFINRQEAVEW